MLLEGSRGTAGPSSPTNPSMADGRHVGAHPGLHSHQRLDRDGNKSPTQPLLDLDEALSHFWSTAPNPRSNRPESFGWWKGKVRGDPRSFATVAASPPMAAEAGRGFRGDRRDGGGANRGGRGGGRNGGRANDAGWGGDRNKYSWRHEDSGGNGRNSTSSTVISTSASGDTSRWDAATAPPHREAREGGVWVEKKQVQADAGGSSGGQTSSPARRPHGKQNAPQVPPSKKSDACLICKSREHLLVRCPRAFCERCNKLGHLASICTVFLPWECIAPMCAFQAKGQGFYYIHDSCTANQVKERSNNIVVTIVEGETSTRQMELDLSDYLATGWRCSAHAIGPGVFVVRFPNPRAVAQICYVGIVTLKTTGSVIRATNWSSAVGAKGVMEVAWIKVSNVPLDKRSERNLAYVASLVGVPLEIDNATLHRPASARVKLGCRNVDEIPVVAESVLGGHFYDFYYVVEQVLIRDPDREKKTVHISPKHDGKRNREGESFGTPGAKQGRTTPGLGEKSPIVPQQEDENTVKDSQESFESDDSLHNILLIESMTSEFLANNEKVDDVVEQEDPMLKVDSKYTVESPETQIETKMGYVEERALVLAKKRDLEGLFSGEDREAMERGAKMLKTNTANMMRLCAAPKKTAAN